MPMVEPSRIRLAPSQEMSRLRQSEVDRVGKQESRFSSTHPGRSARLPGARSRLLNVIFSAVSSRRLWLRVSDACPARRPGLADGQASGSLPGRKPRSAGSRSGVWAQLWRLRRRAGRTRCADEAGVDSRGVQDVPGAQHHTFRAHSAGGDCSLAGAVGRSTRKRSCDGRRRFAGERGGAGGWRWLAHEVSIRTGVGLTVRGA